MSKASIAITIVITVIIVAAIIFFTLVPAGRAIFNGYDRTLKTVDDNTTYESLRMVEDTCRSMIASYDSDIAKAKVYKTSHPDWAEQAAIRANQTAAVYNEYILKNSFVWKNNVPSDIRMHLDYFEFE